MLAIYQTDKTAYKFTVDIYWIRQQNLRLIAKDLGGPRHLAEATGKSESRISQLLADKRHRNIGQRAAREFERLLELPDGDLDIPHPAKVIMYSALLQALAEAVAGLSEEDQKQVLGIALRLKQTGTS